MDLYTYTTQFQTYDILGIFSAFLFTSKNRNISPLGRMPTYSVVSVENCWKKWGNYKIDH